MLLKYGILFCIYFFGGGYIFKVLESDNAKTILSTKRELHVLRSKLKLRFNLTEKENEEYFNDLTLAIRQSGALIDPYKWDYYESCFFAGSILTTIGYGHLYPRTPSGQIFTVVYGILGIPLTLLLLRQLGDKLTKYIYKSIEKVIRGSRRSYPVSSDCFTERPKQVTAETTEKSKKYNWKRKCYELKRKSTEIGKKVRIARNFRENSTSTDIKISILTVVATAVLVTVFVLISAVVRVYSESWSMRESTYFWVITLLTVGLGDYVPYEGHAPPSVFITAVYYVGTFYLLIGLALVASFIQAVSTLMEGRLPRVRARNFSAARQPWRFRNVKRGRDTNYEGGDDNDNEDEANTRPRLSTLSIIVNTRILDPVTESNNSLSAPAPVS